MTLIGQPPIYPGTYGPKLNRENLAVMVEVPIRQYGILNHLEIFLENAR